tara:strand:+ start:29657 stop:30097 length:441 start_codon:yes stop_codon:yes gene_type:complete
MVQKVVTVVRKNWQPILIGIAVIYFWSFIKGLFSFSSEKGIDIKMPESGSRITASQAKRYSDRLYIAMKDIGTDEEEIYSVLFGLTDSDFASIFNSFGLKRYFEGGGVSSEGFVGVDRDLLYWLRSELSKSDLDKITMNSSITAFI